jgi:hypothetical protein
MVRHVVCHSGGHSSALVAIEVVRRLGREDVVLLNHDIHFTVEDRDIKRFKRDVADYLGLPITFANRGTVSQDQFDVCVEAGAFKVDDGPELCTHRLKTEPFMAWLTDNCPNKDCTVYYGFDPEERVRIQRRTGIMAAQGYRTDYPLVTWERTIQRTEDVGIRRPLTYATFKHGNCVGCLKAGWQHWYVVFCTRPDIWLKGKWAEDEIGYAIHHDESGPVFLEDMEPKFEVMRAAGIPATEQIPYQRFWASANKIIKINAVQPELPCECVR